MHVSSKTDDATRIAIYLAEMKKIASSTEISQVLDIPRTYVPKVLKGLVDAGIVASKEGMGGGYYLAKRPEEITLLDIYLTCEPATKISRHLEEKDDCRIQPKACCGIMDYYVELQNEIQHRLQIKTIKEFMS